MSIPLPLWNCEYVGVCCSSFHNSKDKCRISELTTNVVLLTENCNIFSIRRCYYMQLVAT